MAVNKLVGAEKRAEQLLRQLNGNVQTLWKKDLRHFEQCLR
jgi:hypothetical protein